MSKEFRFFLMLTLSMILSIYIIESYNPSLPAITTVFKNNIATASGTVVLYLIGFGISPLLYAPYSDKFGRRPIVLFGIILALFSSILATSAQSIETLLIARLIQGIGMGVVPSTVRCMVADLAKGGNTLGRLIHKSAIIFTLMPAIAPIVGGFMQYHFGWRYNLLTVVILAIITVILSYFILPETLSQKQAHASLAKATKQYLHLLSSPRFLIFPCFSLASFSGEISYLTYSPYFYQIELKLNALQNGLLGIIATLAIIGGHYLNVRMLKKTSLLTMLIISGFWQMLAGIIMLLTIKFLPFSVFTLALPFFLYVLGDSGIIVNAYSRAMEINTLEKSNASAIFSLIQFSGTGLIIFFLMHPHLHSPIALGVVFLFTGGFVFFANIVLKRGKSNI